MRNTARLLALLALLAGAPAHAVPFAVQLGEVRIGVDAPPGFSDSSFTGSPRLQELAEALTSASNRILLFALTDADLRKFMAGDTPELRRYTIAVTPKGLEREHVTRPAFTIYVNDSLRALGSAPRDTDYAKYLAKQPPGQMALLEELRREPEIVSVLQAARIPPAEGTREPARFLAASTTLMLIRGKALNFAAYTAFDGPQDLEWLRATTARWIEEIRRLNGR